MKTFKHDTVVFDLDGTLSCGKHRLHLIPSGADKNKTEAWDEFNMACDGDAPIVDNIELLSALNRMYQIIILTGRNEIARDKTERWLKANGVNCDPLLIMRGRSDHRKDVDFKEDVLNELKSCGHNVLCCFDDLEHVVKHIRAMGVTCHQVTHYDNPTLAEKDHRK